MGDGMTIAYNRDGVPWYAARKPCWLHRCTAQTYGWDGARYVERCACGATRVSFRVWIERNSRKGK